MADIDKQIYRLNTSLAFIVILFSILLVRGIYLVTEQRTFLLKENDRRVQKTKVIPAFRGMILDRNGLPIAMSKVSYTLSVDPSKTQFNANAAGRIADILHLNPAEVISATGDKTRKYKIISRDVSVSAREHLKGIKGLNFEQRETRLYPLADSAAALIGLVNRSLSGTHGVEVFYDKQLKGTDGEYVYEVDAKNHIVGPRKVRKSEVDGQDVRLTIDSKLQSGVYHTLKHAANKYEARGGVALILHVSTGELLAAVNYPSFNPNEPITSFNKIKKNFLIASRYEPGSTIKPIWMAWLLDKGYVSPKDTISTSPGMMRIENAVIKDTRDFGTLSLADIIRKSSNIGMAKLVEDLPYQIVEKMMIDMRLSHHYTIGLPGEVSGEVNPIISQSQFAKLSSAFGYGIAVTPLELARAYNIICNRGVDHPPKILLRQKNKKERVLSEESANQVIEMLKGVVKDGTGRRAKIPGINVAGKTGTSHKLTHGIYKENEHRASFVGFVPAEKPKYLVLVMLDDPQGKWHYGGTSAAPLFANIMDHVLSYDIRLKGYSSLYGTDK
tara:strand:+ start:6473 stop:8140 length:1668 start_codon:yes stop_codon:yes gene_type:complete